MTRLAVTVALLVAFALGILVDRTFAESRPAAQIIPAPTASGGESDPERQTTSPRPSPTVAVLRHPPSPTATVPGPAVSVSGIASWYRYRIGQAAAGPRLRAALGPGWRGDSVEVCAAICIRVRLTDYMVADRLIDLDSRSFAQLAPLSRGLVTVRIHA
jgi:hypothetical protein